MKKITSLFAFTLILSIGFAQQEITVPAKRTCGTVDYLEMQKKNDPDVAERMDRIEQFTQKWIENGGENSFKTSSSVITIPVVVHVLYKTSSQNISDAQIKSQITVLNADYRKLNSDFKTVVPSAFQSAAGDAGIEFCLATVDPNGAATTGIIRKSTTSSSFSTNDYVKYSSKGGDDAWSSSKYLNIWICNLSGGLLGYSQFPGAGSAATDGCVILYSAFGNQGTVSAPYNLGRTVTHEVGHWLNLNHIWGEDRKSVV